MTDQDLLILYVRFAAYCYMVAFFAAFVAALIYGPLYSAIGLYLLCGSFAVGISYLRPAFECAVDRLEKWTVHVRIKFEDAIAPNGAKA